MTITATFGDGREIEFVNNRGWGDFVRWSEKLSVDKYDAIMHLAEHGYVDDPRGLRRQLLLVLKSRKIAASIQTTIRRLAKFLRQAADDDDLIMITDGMTN